MFRTCSRIGCRDAAVARVGLDAPDQRLIVDDALDVPGAMATLCSTHLARLSAPRGWSIDDRRARARSAGGGGAGRVRSPLLEARTPLLERAFRGADATPGRSSGLGALIPGGNASTASAAS